MHLSDTGFDVYSEIVPLSLEYEKKLLDCLTEQQQENLVELIDALQNHANRLDFTPKL